MWTGKGREYWMVFRGPGFLAVKWLSSSPTPFPPLPSVRSTGDTQEDWEIETSFWRDRRESGEELNWTLARKPDPLESFTTLRVIASFYNANESLGLRSRAVWIQNPNYLLNHCQRESPEIFRSQVYPLLNLSAALETLFRLKVNIKIWLNLILEVSKNIQILQYSPYK